MKDYKVRTLKNGEKRYTKDISLGTRLDGSRKRTTITARSVRELRDKEAQLRLNNNLAPVDQSMKIEVAWKNYIDECQRTQAYGTVLSKQSTYNNHLSKYASVRLDKVTESTIRDILEELPPDLKTGTRRTILKNFKVFFSWCVRKKLIQSNPCSNISISGERQTMNFWTEEQFLEFIATVKKPQHRLLYIMAFYTGLRRGELLGLQHEDIHDGIIEVRHQIAWTDDGMRLTDKLKTDNSYRIVPLPNWIEIEDGEGSVFSISYGTVSRAFQNDQKNVEGLPHLRFHDFRHSYASLLISKGVDIYTVSQFMGHSDISITANLYGHLYTDKYDQVRKLLESGGKEEERK